MQSMVGFRGGYLTLNCGGGKGCALKEMIFFTLLQNFPSELQPALEKSGEKFTSKRNKFLGKQ